MSTICNIRQLFTLKKEQVFTFVKNLKNLHHAHSLIFNKSLTLKFVFEITHFIAIWESNRRFRSGKGQKINRSQENKILIHIFRVIIKNKAINLRLILYIKFGVNLIEYFL